MEIPDIEIIERYIILLLGSKNEPIPSELHIQKEMFMLSKINPTIIKFLNFEKHYKGPYSQVLSEAIKEPFYHRGDFLIENRKIFITNKGINEFEDLVSGYKKDENFLKFLKSMTLIRSLYDHLSENELLFLIYTRYPEYTIMSNVSDKLLKNKKMRKQLANSLLERDLITQKRYTELIEDDEYTR